jgi:hypothetical protein
MRIMLDNAQSGGPQLTVVNDAGIICGKVHLRGDSFFSFGSGDEFQTAKNFEERDGIVLFDVQEQSNAHLTVPNGPKETP